MFEPILYIFGFCVLPLYILLVSVVNLIVFLGKEKAPLFIHRVWGWFNILTFQGIMALIFSIIFFSISTSSVDWSLFASIAIFMASLVLVFGGIAFLAKVFIFIRKDLFKDKSFFEMALSREYISEGDATVFQAETKMDVPLGYYLMVQQSLSEKLGGDLRGVLQRENGKNQFQLTLPYARRGVYKLDRTQFIFQDIFGFSRVYVPFATDFELVILPRIPELTRYNFKMSTVKGDHDEYIVLPVNTEDYYATREYVPGDDTRRIHWKNSAKTDKLIIRQPEISMVAFSKVNILILNLRPAFNTFDISYPYELALDNEIRIAAALISYSVANNIPIEVSYFESAGKIVTFNPTNENTQEWKLKLARIEGKESYYSRKALGDFLKLNNSCILITSEISSLFVNQMFESIAENNTTVEVLFSRISKYMIKSQNVKRKFNWVNIFLGSPYFERVGPLAWIAQKLFKRKTEFTKKQYEEILEKESATLNLFRSKNAFVKVFGDCNEMESEENNILRILENE